MRFFGKEEYPVHRPDFRSALAAATDVKLGSPLPDSILTRGGVVLFSYPGREDPLDISPAMAGLVKFADAVSEASQECRVAVVVRANYIEGLNPSPYQHVLEREGLTLEQALDPIVIAVGKGDDGRYHAGLSDTRRIVAEIKRDNLVAMAPGESTHRYGLPGHGYRSSGARLAVELGRGLYTLAINTSSGPGQELVAQAIHVREIDLPRIYYDPPVRRGLAGRIIHRGEIEQEKREIRHEANLGITHFAMAVIASCLPQGPQRGDFQNPPLEMRRAVRRIRGLQDEGLIAVRGFMEDGRIFRY